MNIRFHAHVVTVCAVLALLFLTTTPVFAAGPATCLNGCEKAGVADVGKCVTDCEKVVGASDGGEDVSIKCYFELVADCDTLGISTIIDVISDCIRDDFSPSCFTHGTCDADLRCVEDICGCVQNKVSKAQCVDAWKKGCR